MAPEIEAVPRSSKAVETLAKLDWINPKPVALLELPERRPPNVNWPIVRVPALYELRALVRRPVVAVRVVPLKPLVRSNEPAKELEPVPLEKN